MQAKEAQKVCFCFRSKHSKSELIWTVGQVEDLKLEIDSLATAIEGFLKLK